MTLLRSTVFFVYFVIVSVVVYLAALVALLLPRRAMVHFSRSWSRATLWGLKVFANLDYEVRGAPPQTPVIIAAKHMTMWDSMAFYLLVFDTAAVVKRELLSIPFYGWYIGKAGVIAIDRGGHASALRKMTAAAKAVFAAGRSILIFPEGTRKKPGAPPDYKPGVAGLYGQLDVPCVPVALNSGLYWTAFIKRPGRIVVEFLPAIPPGLPRREFMATLEERIETATNKLLAEARR